MTEEHEAWKRAQRDTVWRALDPSPTPPSTTPPSSGGAPSPTAPPARSSKAADAPPGMSGSSGISATATAPAATPPSPRSSSTSVASTPPSGNASMDWTQSPIGYVAAGYGPETPSPDLSHLPGPARLSLVALAMGNNEPVAVTIGRICEFLIEEEADQAEGPLDQAVLAYLGGQR